MTGIDKDLGHLSKGEILVVEDNTSDLKLMMDILKAAGYRVRPATDGEIALRSSKARPPDLILLDVNLPDTSGVAVCRQLKADPVTRKIPVIFISALDETDLKVKAIEGGGVDYITKPFQPPEVIARIKTQMEVYQLQCELVAQSAELIREINERKRIERELATHTGNLEALVEQRTEYLRKSEKDLKESQRIAHVGSWRLDLRTDNVVWSEELYRMCGFDPALPPPPYAEHHKLFTVDSWNRLSAALSHTMDTGNPYELELETIRQDGRAGWMWVCGEAVFDGNTLVGLRGAAQDITERKQTEETLKESKLFLDNMSDIAYVADDNGNLTWINAASERIIGISVEDVIGKPFFRLFSEKDQGPLMEVYHRTLNGESLENSLTFTSGVTCHFTSLPKYNPKGEIVGTFGVARDITDRLIAEKKIQISEERLKKAQSVAKIGNWEYDISTGQIWGSEEAFRIYGIEQETPFLPLDEVENCIIEAKRVNQSLVDLITKNAAYDIEFEINPVNREGVTAIRSIAELICDEGGNPVKVTGVIQDITESKAKEKDRLKLRAQLQQAQRMESIGTLAGGISHDFNNMLSVILGHADMALEEVDPSSPFHDILIEIKEAGERSANLTRQLLAFARKQTISPKVLDLNKTVGSMLSMLQRIIGEDIDTAWIPGQGVWPVKMDPSQIDQILANLCVNARDAISGIGKVTIETANVEMDGAYCSQHLEFVPGEYVLLAVSDNGCGMDAKTQSQIFEPFFTTKGTGQGTGLGLATVYGVVKQNQGVINVYSEVGQGTTFKIYFPRFKTVAGLSSARGPAGQVEHGHETILLVEDEAAILRMTTMMLERLGYTVLSAQSPGEAISTALAYEGEIHLLITDVVMPEMNGRDLAESILSGYPNLKRLFMSGYTANVIAHHGVLDEGVNFIQKPFSREGLGIKVREALDK